MHLYDLLAVLLLIAPSMASLYCGDRNCYELLEVKQYQQRRV